MLIWLSAAAACMWIALLLLPWRPWSTRERLEINAGQVNLGNISVLIPARDEAVCIGETLTLLGRQGTFARVVVIDDQSTDGTGEIAQAQALDNLLVIDGTTPEPGWSGKLWALQQGLRHCESRYILLLDADIGLAQGAVGSLLERLEGENLDMISVMANLHMHGFWERLLLPPFVYFFKLIYPFSLANRHHSRIAAAAGGCILLRKSALEAIGEFGALKNAIIDDCTLAQKIKRLPGRIWIGLSNDAKAVRPYDTLSNIWDMVARSAYTQLGYSPVWLALCTVMLVVSFIVPVVALFAGGDAAQLAVIALAAMFASYLPTARYYDLPSWWVFTLLLAAPLFLAMTWTSASRYVRGERSRWKGRTYAATSLTSGIAVPDGNELSSRSTLNREGAQATGQD